MIWFTVGARVDVLVALQRPDNPRPTQARSEKRTLIEQPLSPTNKGIHWVGKGAVALEAWSPAKVIKGPGAK